MVISDRGRQIILEAVPLSLTAYRCPFGVWTIGFGHWGDVKRGDEVTRHQADTIFEFDLQTCEDGIAQLAPKANANQFSALVSLAMDIGVDALASSRLLREFNAEHPHTAAALFMGYVPRVHNPGVWRRRHAERTLFMELPS